MLGRLFRNIFAASYQGEVGAERFNHCSTVSPHSNGVVLAWYSGSGECRDDQSVYVTSYNQGTYTRPLRIGDRTGNPVVFPHGDHTYLVWSKFEDTGEIRSIVDRWKHCSLWIQRIDAKNGISFVEEPRRLAPSEFHLLGRCNPICYGQVGYRSDYLLPLYDEVGRQGVIYRLRLSDRSTKQEKNFSMHINQCSVVGNNVIQPTLWQTGDRIHALFRNFGTKDTACRYSYSDDRGSSWSKLVPTSILNRNSSCHAIDWGGKHYLLWNDTEGISRINLRLGEIIFDDETGSVPRVETICTIAEKGHYPSMCIDNSDNLHMTFSNSQRKIEHHVWNRKQLENTIRRGSYLVG